MLRGARAEVCLLYRNHGEVGQIDLKLCRARVPSQTQPDSAQQASHWYDSLSDRNA